MAIGDHMRSLHNIDVISIDMLWLQLPSKPYQCIYILSWKVSVFIFIEFKRTYKLINIRFFSMPPYLIPSMWRSDTTHVLILHRQWGVRPVNTTRLYKIYAMFNQRRRCWFNIAFIWIIEESYLKSHIYEVSEDSYLRSHIWRVISGEYLKTHISEVISEDSYLKSHIWGVISEESHWRNYIWGVISGESLMSHIWGVIFEESHLESHIWGVTSEESH